MSNTRQKRTLIGSPLFHLPVVSSTNDLAMQLARLGCSEGTTVVADFQTSGRGRLGRAWHAPARSSLLLSVVFRPLLAPSDVHQLTMLCGLAVVRAVSAGIGLDVALKWPNDIVRNGKKVGGILAEAAIMEERIEYCVVGLGLNAQLEPDQLGAALAMPASSLSKEAGRPILPWPLLQHILGEMDTLYMALRGGWSPWSEWAASLVTLGHDVCVSSQDRQLLGVACGVEPNGALLVRLADGRTEHVMAEDVTLRDDAGWHQP